MRIYLYKGMILWLKENGCVAQFVETKQDYKYGQIQS